MSSHLIEVSFKGNRKEFFLWNEEALPPLKAPVVVEADRGEDLGFVLASGEMATKRAAGCSHGPGQEPVTRVVRRVASDEELKRLHDLREQDEQARRQVIERVRSTGLGMKISDAEWRWDRRKLTLYFTAERRVDFRELVRDLAAMFRTRIELKQIGVRDEAKRLSGIGRCGREYCSASWLPELRPVNLGVAKDQRLSLNPSQISGACGRLMCCLRYEHEFYVRQRKRFPKEGRLVMTTRGEEKIVANDIFRERVTLRGAEGETRVVPLLEFRRETGVGATTEMPLTEETPAYPMEALTDEVIRLQDTAERPAWKPREPKDGGAGREAQGDRSGRTLPVVDSALDTRDSALGTRHSAPDSGLGARHSAPDSGLGTRDSALGAEQRDGEADALSNDTEPGAESERQGRRRRRGRRGGRRGRPSPPSTGGDSGEPGAGA